MNLVKRKPDVWLPSILDEFLKTDWMGGTESVPKIGSTIPAVNITENEDNFIVEVAAPGKEKKDFNIELNNDVLTISSEEKNENENKEENGRVTRREFSYSSFKRAFNLPESVNNDMISAVYTNGVLMITLPKKEEAKVQPKRMIEIE
ncbi:MAG TPA: Hsp20/alpha crystallin family protein [Salinimicrobium sp.]|nr:Hsp20/alpha crystallin family protein [Salinimicrobium sp.]